MDYKYYSLYTGTVTFTLYQLNPKKKKEMKEEKKPKDVYLNELEELGELHEGTIGKP